MKKTKETKAFSWHTTKRVVFLVILSVYAILALTNQSNFLVQKSTPTGVEQKQYEDSQFLSLGANDVIKQEFYASTTRCSGFSFYFKNPNQTSTEGYLTLELYNSDDELLAYNSATGASLNNLKRHNFPLEATLVKGEKYYFKLICQDLTNTYGVSILLLPEEHKLLDGTFVNGEAQKLPLDTKFKYYRYDLKLIVVTLILWLFVLSLVMLPKKFWVEKLNGEQKKLYQQCLFAMSPFFSFWIMERFNDVPITKIMKTPLYFTLNLLIYFTLLLIFYLITNRVKIATLLLVFSTFTMGCVSYYVNIFRGAPVYPSDFLSIGTALNVASNYQFTITLMVLNNLILLLAFCVPVIMLEGHKGMNWKQRIAVLFTLLVCCGTIQYVYFDGAFLKSHNIKVSSFKPRRGYRKYGYAMSFMIQTYYLIPDKPDGYSVEAAEKIAANYQSDPVDMETDVQPNIICIMNETFSDLNYIDEVETTEEILPFINSLKENTIKGKLNMSIFGSNTANSEFEFLTGNSMAFLPGRTVVYEFFVRNAMPNLTYNLTSTGYTYNKALHPFKRDGWNREYVYQCMGFSEFKDQTMFTNQDKVRKFISDEADFKEIIQEYEKTRESSDDPFYLFNVTMQNHGGYGALSGVIDEPVQFKDPYLQKSAMATQYLNLMHLSDQATEELIHYFEQVDEPTVIVMFGDHMATLSEKIYERIYGKSLNSLDVEETNRMYTTPYFIWANYDIPEEENLDMSANYLSSYLLKTLGLPMTGYQKYLMDLYEKLPVISQICHKDADGNYYAREDENSPYRDLLNEYHILQYNNVIDYKNRIDGFFTLDGFELPEVDDNWLTNGTEATETIEEMQGTASVE